MLRRKKINSNANFWKKSSKNQMGYGHFAILNLWLRQLSEWGALASMEIIFLQLLILKLNEDTKRKYSVHWGGLIPHILAW